MTPVERVERVGPERAEEVLATVRAGFGAREVLDPAAGAADETLSSVTATLAAHGGLLASGADGPTGALLLDPADGVLRLRRVAVHPDAQGRGVAGALVRAAEAIAAERRLAGLEVTARVELPGTVRFWQHQGYVEVARDAPFVTMTKLLPVELVTPTGEATRDVAERLAPLLRAGDLVILSGDLGAGKTTFVQGLGAGLGVRGPVTSPTFVISRVHPSLVGGPPLVHVDAYRLGGIEELDDLDLDTSLEEAVTVVEWGEDLAEELTDARLEIRLTRSRAGRAGSSEPSEPSVPAAASEPPVASDPRTLRVTPIGARWRGTDLRTALVPASPSNA